MPGMRETQLTADVELLSSTIETSKNKQQTRPPISMNFEVCKYKTTLIDFYFVFFCRYRLHVLD